MSYTVGRVMQLSVAPLLFVLLSCTTHINGVKVVIPDQVPMNLTDILASQATLPWGVIAATTAGGRRNFKPVTLPASKMNVTVRGHGSLLPKELWQAPSYFEGPAYTVSPPPSPPSPPPPPPSPPTPPAPPDYTAINWWQLAVYDGHDITLEAGQTLTFSSLALLLTDVRNPMGYYVQHPESMAPSTIFLVPFGATLQFIDVTLVVSEFDLVYMMVWMCQGGGWSYNLDIEFLGGILRIRNFTSRAPGQDGKLGSGGEVRWSNVTITCPGDGKPRIWPCAVQVVTDGSKLLDVAAAALPTTQHSVFISVASDMALPPQTAIGDKTVAVDMNKLVFLGDPARPPTLDLSGSVDAIVSRANWFGMNEATGLITAASFYNMILVNLPPATRPNSSTSLLSVGLHSFGINRGVLILDNAVNYVYYQTQVQFFGCTLVVPDPEVDFLARAVGRNSSDVWPGAPPAGFEIEVQATEGAPAESPVGRLELGRMRLMSEVLLLNSTLLSASHYSGLPGAVPLLPQSRLWIPELLEPLDKETVERWGPGGLTATSGFQQALVGLFVCGKRADYNPTRLIWRTNDDSVPRLNVSEDAQKVQISGDGELAPAGDCAVDAFPLNLAGGPVFVDLKGAIGRFKTVRPITLRNLVLYNLAPGGQYPEGLTDDNGKPLVLPPPAPLEGTDSSWTNSSLPLWFFDVARSDAALRYVPSPEELVSPLPAWVTDLGNGVVQLPPRLVLENVTLVVPEPEWRAMVAAVLLHHVPQAVAQAREQQQQQQRRRRQQEQVAMHVAYDHRPQLAGSSGGVSPSGHWISGGLPTSQDVASHSIHRLAGGRKLAAASGLGEGVAHALMDSAVAAAAAATAAGTATPQVTKPDGRESRTLFQDSQPSSGEPFHDSGFGDWGVALPPGADFGGGSADDNSTGSGFPGPRPAPAAPPQQPASPSSGPGLPTSGIALQPRPPEGVLPNPSEPPAHSAPPNQDIGMAPGDGKSYSGNGPTYQAWPRYPPSPPFIPQPPSAPSPSPPPPHPPAPLPSPPHFQSTNTALSSVGASSKVLRYDYRTGVLVLSAVQHYGWQGSSVTITHKLPPGAPPAARLLNYPPLVLPYQELADMPIDIDVGFPSTVSPPLAADPTPRGYDVNQAGPPIARSPNNEFLPPAPQPQSQAESQAPPKAQPRSADLLYQRETGGNDGTDSEHDNHPGWVIPVVVALAALAGVLLVAGLVLLVVRQRSRRRKEGQAPDNQFGGASLASGAGGTAGGSHCHPEVAIVCDESGAGKVDRLHHSAKEGMASGSTKTVGLQSGGHAAGVSGVKNADGNGAWTTTSAYEANRTAVSRALALALSPPQRRSSAVTPEQVSEVSEALPAVGDVGVTAERGDETACCTVPEGVFLHGLEAYFADLVIVASGLGKERSEGAPATEQQQIALPHAIEALQAELRDPDLAVETVLGRGASGVVYRGMWRGLPVAVKTLVVPASSDGNHEGRIRQQAVLEAAISLSMINPNVVATYTYNLKPLVHAPPAVNDTADDEARAAAAAAAVLDGGGWLISNDAEHCEAFKMYIVQEFCNGGSLCHALERGMAGCVRVAGFTRTLALRLALDVARGMRHIHASRIVHGDLKPDNVLLTFVSQSEQSGEEAWSGAAASYSAATAPVADSKATLRLTAKVADFGLSLPLPEGATHLSKRFRGTPTYVAPEVIATGNLSPRSDVWSFGVLLVELYYGCTMIQVRALHEAMVAAKDAAPKLMEACLLEDMMRSTMRPYTELVVRCLHGEPRARPTMEEVVDRLEALSGVSV